MVDERIQKLIGQSILKDDIVPIAFVPMPGSCYRGIAFTEFKRVVGITLEGDAVGFAKIDGGKDFVEEAKHEGFFVKGEVFGHQGLGQAIGA